MNKRIFLSPPHLGEYEKKFVEEAFCSNWIAPLGPNVDGFENDLSNYLHGYEVAVLSSGTAAIHLALILLGINVGDEVICQSFTFAGSANPIVYLGAKPIFVDSESDTLNIDPFILEETIKKRIKYGKKPKAIIAVDLYGMPAKMHQILNVALNYEIPVIEDAAEAFGSSIDNKKCGTFGDIGILSFNGNKIITTSGGGALISKNAEIVSKARFLATQARDPLPYYEHSHIGYNYRMSNIIAGIGRGQMLVLEDRIKRRRNNFNRYIEYFKKLNSSKGYNILWIIEPEGFFSNRWLTTIFVDPKKNNGINREMIWQAFEANNIESRPVWKPMHLQPVFKEYPYYGDKVAENAFNSGICLPSGSNLTEDDWVRIFEVLDNIFI